MSALPIPEYMRGTVFDPDPLKSRTIGDMSSSIPRKPIWLDGPQDAPQQQQAPGLPPELEAMRPQKRDTWRDVLGSIFDAMSAFGGGQANYWNGVNEDRSQFEDLQRQYTLMQQHMKAQAQMDLQKRAQALQDFESKDPYLRALKNAGIDPNSEEGIALQQKRARNMAEKMQFIPDGFGGGQWATVGGGSDAGGGLPDGFDPSEWEVVDGGPASAPDGFPQ